MSRSHGEGSIFQRKDGRWQASLQVAEEKARQRALWCECQAAKWRLKGWDDLADAYERRAADWRAEAERWKARQAREGGHYAAHRDGGQ